MVMVLYWIVNTLDESYATNLCMEEKLFVEQQLYQMATLKLSMSKCCCFLAVITC